MKIRLNPSVKVSQRISFKALMYITGGVVIAIIVGIIMFFYLNLGVSSTALGATTDLSGVINSYLRVTNLNSSQRKFTADNLSGSISNFQAGKKLLIYQTKGASISTSNNSSHGSITSYGNAGNFEIATIQSISGSSPYTIIVTSLTNAYTTSGAIQLVSVPTYENVNVTGTILPIAWDAAQGRGGIVAMEVSNTLTLGGNISASGMGFVGGVKGGSDGGCPNNTTYTTTSNNYAAKGEGISSGGNDYGRGPRANGGGGGNPHNAGGAGGSNFSFGGSGGRGYQPGGSCSVLNAGGINGYKINYAANPLKAFFGGGGGAGQQNDNLASNGGAGGGLIVVRAGKITSTCATTYGILADGQNAANSGGNDAAGGGGAGGAIILDVLNYDNACNIFIRANGGNGGTVSNAAEHGGGGGGGIGVVMEVNPTSKSNVQIASIPGTNGKDCNTGTCPVTGSLPETPSTSKKTLSAMPGDLITLPIVLKSFEGQFEAGLVRLNWITASEENNDFFTLERSKDGIDFIAFSEIKGAGNSSRLLYYEDTDHAYFTPYTYYRLKQTDYDGKFVYSKIISVPTDNKRPDNLFYPNPARDQITIAGFKEEMITIRIVNESGSEVLHASLGLERELDISSLKTGLYILEVISNKQKQSHRLIIKRN